MVPMRPIHAAAALSVGDRPTIASAQAFLTARDIVGAPRGAPAASSWPPPPPEPVPVRPSGFRTSVGLNSMAEGSIRMSAPRPRILDEGFTSGWLFTSQRL